MLPLTSIVHRSRAYDGRKEGKTFDYMFASCLELGIGVMSKHLGPEKYRTELTDKLAGLVTDHITNVMKNYPNPYAIYLSGSKPDPDKHFLIIIFRDSAYIIHLQPIMN